MDLSTPSQETCVASSDVLRDSREERRGGGRGGGLVDMIWRDAPPFKDGNLTLRVFVLFYSDKSFKLNVSKALKVSYVILIW